MPSNEEITAALLVLRTSTIYGIEECDMRADHRAMLHAAKLVRDAKMERKSQK